MEALFHQKLTNLKLNQQTLQWIPLKFEIYVLKSDQELDKF